MRTLTVDEFQAICDYFSDRIDSHLKQHPGN